MDVELWCRALLVSDAVDFLGSLAPTKIAEEKMISKEGKLLHGHPLISSRVQGRKGKETWESVEIAPQICTYHQFHENKGGLPPRLLIPPTHTMGGGRGNMPFDMIKWLLQSELYTTPIHTLSFGQRRCLEQAMLQDLLTIRADRDNYYYGCDALFNRHPELIHRLCLLVCVKTRTNKIRASDRYASSAFER